MINKILYAACTVVNFRKTRDKVDSHLVKLVLKCQESFSVTAGSDAALYRRGRIEKALIEHVHAPLISLKAICMDPPAIGAKKSSQRWSRFVRSNPRDNTFSALYSTNSNT